MPYFYSSSDSTEAILYRFTRTVSNPFEKTSKRFKVKYYVGNEFKEKYTSHLEIRNIEREIEEKYMDYLNKTCEENKEAKEKMKKRLVYYKKGTINYNMKIEDISKVDLTICKSYIKKYITYKNKTQQIESKENEENDEDNKDEEKEKEENDDEE